MRQFGIFAKYWQPGAVKTRLATTIGDCAASRLYRALLVCSLRRFSEVAERRVLAFTPADRRAEFQSLAGTAWRIEPQAAGDLGCRMERFFQSALDAGAERVVLIGSDSPTVPIGFVADAFERLRRSSVVLGPSDDGGYYLIGIAGAVPPVFEGIAWSSPHVWDETVALLEQADLDFAVLSPWYDVDDSAGLERLAEELRDHGALSPPLRELSEVVQEILPDGAKGL